MRLTEASLGAAPPACEEDDAIAVTGTCVSGSDAASVESAPPPPDPDSCAVTWSQTDKVRAVRPGDVRTVLLLSLPPRSQQSRRFEDVATLATTVLTAHWDTFVQARHAPRLSPAHAADAGYVVSIPRCPPLLQFFRRHPSRRRRKWYYELGGTGGTVPLGETMLSPAAGPIRRLSATLVSAAPAARAPVPVPVPVRLPGIAASLPPPSAALPPAAPPALPPAPSAAASPGDSPFKRPPPQPRMARQASMEAGTPSAHTLLHVTARELLLEVGDVAPLGAQLGVPALHVREVRPLWAGRGSWKRGDGTRQLLDKTKERG